MKSVFRVERALMSKIALFDSKKEPAAISGATKKIYNEKPAAAPIKPKSSSAPPLKKINASQSDLDTAHKSNQMYKKVIGVVDKSIAGKYIKPVMGAKLKYVSRKANRNVIEASNEKVNDAYKKGYLYKNREEAVADSTQAVNLSNLKYNNLVKHSPVMVGELGKLMSKTGDPRSEAGVAAWNHAKTKRYTDVASKENGVSNLPPVAKKKKSWWGS